MYACLIIDDPLLTRNYGFIDYKKLLSLMDKYNFHTSIAFVPYNYNRSEKEVVNLFLDRPDRYSLLIHGCDHTECEFGITDKNQLDRKCKLALSRMERHRELTGIDHDNIVVFPQGSFTVEAAEALKNNGFWAAINSNRVTELGKPGPLCNDLEYISGLPVYPRWYPDNACFSEKLPIFLVEHHKYFKDYSRICTFVSHLNDKFPDLIWTNPGTILKNFGVECKPIETIDIDESPHMKIRARRLLTEFRDNYLDKNETLSRVAYAGKGLIKKFVA